MGTPIAGKPHTSPLVGTEKVPLSPDGFATTGEIAGLATGGGVSTVSVDLSSADIATLNDSPVEVVAAQGAGTAVAVVAASLHFVGGTQPFSENGEGLALGYAEGNPLATATVGWALSLADRLAEFTIGGLVVSPAPFVNQPLLLLQLDTDPGYTGGVLTASLGDAGSGYAPGDYGYINPPFGLDSATYEIETVGGGGEVETFTILTPGSGHAPANGVPSFVSTGGGDGLFTVNINSISPLSDGTARITVLYYVMDLA